MDRFLWFVATLIVGILILRYTDWIVRMVGKSDFAERYLGLGGTYTMWKLVALFIMILGLLFWLPPAAFR